MNNLSESKNSAEKHPDSEAILKKFWICSFATQEMYGSQNLHRTLEMVWTILYSKNPKEMENNIKELGIPFPDRMKELNEPIGLKNIKIPDKEEFVSELRHLLNRLEYDQAVSIETKEQIYQLMKRGPVIIWTAGDTKGIRDEKGEIIFPGSHVQLFKVSKAGFNDLRKKYALENSNPEENIDYHDVLSVLASEDKINEVTKIVKEFISKKISNIILVEDRFKNIEKATEKIKQWLKTNNITDVNLTTVLVGKKEIESTKPVTIGQGKFYEINEFVEVEKIISENELLNNNLLGSIVDYDGVLSNDQIRRKIMNDKIIDVLSEKHWI